MPKKRIAIAGAGNMARVRGRAFLDTGRAEICAVAARHVESARCCAAELGCDVSCDDFRRLAEAGPDAVLIETPHRVQDEIALWALETGFDLLIGGSLASSVENGRRIVELAGRYGRVVEAGYQRRYDPAWAEIHRLVRDRVLGEPVMAVSMALWNPDPCAWYYDQEASGGMPLTHLSYCYLNAVRWILGRPTAVSAMANRKRNTDPGHVMEETCAALIGLITARSLRQRQAMSVRRGWVTPRPGSSARREGLCPMRRLRPAPSPLPFSTRVGPGFALLRTSRPLLSGRQRPFWMR